MKPLPSPHEIHPFADFLTAEKAIRDAIEAHTRYILFTGESGAGKTTLLRELAASIDPCRYRIVYFNLSRLSPGGLVRVLARALRMPFSRSQPETIQALSRLLQDEPVQTLLWVDEAQLLPDETFSEIRTLAEADLGGTLPLAFLLAGLPLLRERLQAPVLFPLWRRLLHRIEITGLRQSEAHPFAIHHIGEARTARIDAGALDAIFERSRGLPGLFAAYLDIVGRDTPEGSISREAAEAAIQRWNLP